MKHGHPRGQKLQKRQNIAHGREVSLLRDGERWLFMGIKKYHKHKTPKLGSGAAW